MMRFGQLLRKRNEVAYSRKIRRKFHRSRHMPADQMLKQRDDTVSSVMAMRKTGSGFNERERRAYLEEKLYSAGSRMERQGAATNVNKTYALQGLGDMEPLSGSLNFGVADTTFYKYDSKEEMARYEAPPAPFTPLAARKLAEGKFWPTAPEPSNLTSREVTRLRHEKNMSPSANKYSTHIEYYIRRDIKSCPSHISENIDFAQLVIKEVIASRRGHKIFIVWTTVHPGARFELEPHIIKLGAWVQHMIMRRIKVRPNIPRVEWIYDSGALQRELPKELQNKLESMLAESASTIEDRMQHLKKMDSLEYKMKSIPWFMPYLWSKDKKMLQRKAVMADAAEVEARKKDGGGTGKPSYTA